LRGFNFVDFKKTFFLKFARVVSYLIIEQTRRYLFMKKTIFILCMAGIVFSPGCIDFWKKGKKVKKEMVAGCPCGETVKGECTCAGEARKVCPCGGEMAVEEETKKISAEELKKEMEANPDLTVINVLSEKAFDNCKIEGSINLPLAGGKLEDAAEGWEKDKRLILYCANYKCMASRNAYEVLEKMGFTNMAAYEGGMKEWHDMGFPREGVCDANFLK
jgi:rhodanese-related sulfurtransferase